MRANAPLTFDWSSAFDSQLSQYILCDSSKILSLSGYSFVGDLSIIHPQDEVQTPKSGSLTPHTKDLRPPSLPSSSYFPRPGHMPVTFSPSHSLQLPPHLPCIYVKTQFLKSSLWWFSPRSDPRGRDPQMLVWCERRFQLCFLWISIQDERTALAGDGFLRSTASELSTEARL